MTEVLLATQAAEAGTSSTAAAAETETTLVSCSGEREMVCFAESVSSSSPSLCLLPPPHVSLSLAREGRHPRLSDRQAKADEREREVKSKGGKSD